MNNIKFKSKAKKSQMKLPKKYKELNSEEVKLISLPKNENSKNSKLNKFMKFAEEMKITLPKDYKFDREELYGR